jgi:phosphate transport system protein
VRDTFHEQLDELGDQLGQMAEVARRAMGDASVALLDVDREAGQRAHDATAELGQLFQRADELACLALARQQPVASDLRLIVASLHASADLDRMGKLADHVARIALRHHPEPVVRIEACPYLREMAAVADQMAGKAAQAIRDRDATLADELPHDDDRMDALHRRLWATLLGDWRDGVQPAIDAAMLGRFYERYADHAVSAAHQIVYVVTGEA